MRSWIPYVWKEVHESWRLALAALGVSLGISFIPSILSAARGQGNWHDGNVLGVLFLGGPLLAVVAGVYAMGREQGAIERFWRSRPVNLNRWLLIKYVTGLLLVWLICWLPLGIQILGRALEQPHHSMSDDVSMALVYSFILLLIYSVSLVLGQCVRGMLHAAILAVGAMALIFVIPLVIAPLNWLSVEMVQRADRGALNVRAHIIFAVPMIALSAALVGLAGILLKRNVQVEVGGRTLGWSVAAIMLVLTAGMAFPMATNLSVQQVISLPMAQDGTVHDMAADGNDVLILFSNGSVWRGSKLGLVRVRIGEHASVVDEPIWFADPGQERAGYYSGLDLAWPAEDPSLAYAAIRHSVLENGALKESASVLYTVALDAKRANPVIHRVELNPLLTLQDSRQAACLYQRRLYISSIEPGGIRLLTFSLADLRAPLLVHSEDVTHPLGWLHRGPSQEYQVPLVPMPDLDESTRCKVTRDLALHYSRWVPAGNDRILASDRDSGRFLPHLVLYEAGPTRDGVMPLRPISRYQSVAFEGLLGTSDGELLYSAPLAYRLEGGGVTVYRIGESKSIERIGHYAAEGGFNTTVSLPGNRVVLAGKRLHVLDLSEKLRQ
ncbi:MAG: hypothetical protein ABFD90_05830 [Phycisphaerales bacterium]